MNTNLSSIGTRQSRMEHQARILAAARLLMREGNFRPTALEISRLAGVATARIYDSYQSHIGLLIIAAEDPATANAILTLAAGDDWKSLSFSPRTRHNLLRAIILGKVV